MAEIQLIPQPQSTPGNLPGREPKPNGKPAQKRGPPLHEIYKQPAPIRTFPLPTFYPGNPLSFFHVAYAWLQQVLWPPASEPAVIHNGIWSSETTSVHITDESSMRAFWEQGFYGKGSLSRSEPNWLRREEVRRGVREGHVSEIVTLQRREERQKAKWERARLEQEAIRQTRLQEAGQASPRPPFDLLVIGTVPEILAPVGPLQLLALPNSPADLLARQQPQDPRNGDAVLKQDSLNGGIILPKPVLPEIVNGVEFPVLQTLGKPMLVNGLENEDQNSAAVDGLADVSETNGQVTPVKETPTLPSPSSDGSPAKTLKRQKSVRFSPTVESTTFELLDPPSPNHAAAKSRALQASLANGSATSDTQDVPTPPLLDEESKDAVTHTPETIVNKEHLQLMPEEAFFLSFAFGTLNVTEPASGRVLSNTELFKLFRQHSYFPPRDGPDDPDLQPDDEFLVNYAVYHHFRSLGWVPRAGIKFGVDWLLYTRGPVFDHAEFGLIVLPSYSDPGWAALGKRSPRKTWQWLHSIVRVLSHVTKSLVLVYVDVPPPSKFDKALEKGFAEAFKQYRVREVMVKRWSSNRNR